MGSPDEEVKADFLAAFQEFMIARLAEGRSVEEIRAECDHLFQVAHKEVVTVEEAEKSEPTTPARPTTSGAR